MDAPGYVSAWRNRISRFRRRSIIDLTFQADPSPWIQSPLNKAVVNVRRAGHVIDITALSMLASNAVLFVSHNLIHPEETTMKSRSKICLGAGLLNFEENSQGIS